MNADVARLALMRLMPNATPKTTTSSRTRATMNSGIPVLVRNSCESVLVSTAETTPVTTRPPSIQAKTCRTKVMSLATGRCSTYGAGGAGVDALNSMAATIRAGQPALLARLGVLRLGRIGDRNLLNRRDLGRVAQVPLRIQGGLAAGAGGGHRLTVRPVDEVARGEHAGTVRLGGLSVGDDVALLVEVDLALDDPRLRDVADGDEGACDLDLALGPVLGVAQVRGRQRPRVVARGELLDDVGRDELDVVVLARALEHDLRGAELVAAVHDLDLGGELAQEDRLLHRRVAAADDDRRLVAEERGVAGGAVGHAAAAELVLAGDAELAVLGPHGQDHGAGQVFVVPHVDAVYPAGLVGQLNARDLVGDEPRAEALGLVAELLHELGAHDPVGETRVVLDVGGLLEQAAPEQALDHERTQIDARGVQRGRVSGRAAADDDHVLDVLLAHVASAVTLLCIVAGGVSDSQRR